MLGLTRKLSCVAVFDQLTRTPRRSSPSYGWSQQFVWFVGQLFDSFFCFLRGGGQLFDILLNYGSQFCICLNPLVNVLTFFDFWVNEFVDILFHCSIHLDEPIPIRLYKVRPSHLPPLLGNMFADARPDSKTKLCDRVRPTAEDWRVSEVQLVTLVVRMGVRRRWGSGWRWCRWRGR